MARWIGAQGQVISATKAREHAPIMTSPIEKLKPKTKKIFFQSKLEALPMSECNV